MMCSGPHLGVFYYLITLLLTPRSLKFPPPPLQKARGVSKGRGDIALSILRNTIFVCGV